jgi:hypothetical protein
VLLPQCVPQVPQFALSLRRSTHAFPQDVKPAAQPHTPALHVWFAGQAWPQLPQSELLV